MEAHRSHLVRMPWKGLFAAAVAAALLPAGAFAQRAVLVVRHAEKESDSSEKSVRLSAAGAERAERLAALLKDAGVTAIYSTDTVRTRSTVEPLAKARNLTVKIYDPRDAKGTMTAEPLVASLAKDEKDGVVLVVGHSNTVPDLVKALGWPELIRIADPDYGDLFLVVLKPSGPPTMLRLKF